MANKMVNRVGGAVLASCVAACASTTTDKPEYGTLAIEIDLSGIESAATLEEGSRLTLGLMLEGSSYFQNKRIAFDTNYHSLSCVWIPEGRYSLVYLDHDGFREKLYPAEGTQFFSIESGSINYAGAWNYSNCMLGGRNQVCVRVTYPNDWQQRGAACAQNDIPVEVRRTGPGAAE